MKFLILAICLIATGLRAADGPLAVSGGSTTTSSASNSFVGSFVGNARGVSGITNLYMIAGGSSCNVGGWSTTPKYYHPFGGSGMTNGVAAGMGQQLLGGVYVRDLVINITGVGNDTNVTVTIFTNGAASNLACGGTPAIGTVTASDTTHEVFLPNNQILSLEIKGNNASAANTGTVATWSFRYHY